MKFPTTCEEFLTTLKAKSKVEGRQQKSKSESCDSFNYEEALKVLGEKRRKSAREISDLLLLRRRNGDRDGRQYFG